ncbi:MAG: glutamate--tRNA ligase [Chloroflexi bacterium]|nr:glutamate--tRNA ligase [Chloroflexota bacterium]
MPVEVRVRYAPSPTGEPHLGNIRTALFNWLFARHWGGTFIVRIEDTDVTRKVEGAVENNLKSLRWLGLDWDEGPEVGGSHAPYFQSERLALYQEVAVRLLEEGYAYRCYCSPERLNEMRQEQQSRKQPSGYDRHCLGLSHSQVREYEVQGITPVVRFKMPLEGETAFEDLVRGHVSFENRLLDDFVMLKSDGFPTYHLANVVDDHSMEITHVMRAEEWLPSTPRHIQIYRVLGWEPPLFVHLPMILGPDRSKLSKRHGATSVLEYRDMGYLPEVVFNFLALLGWSLDDKTEIMSREDVIKSFTLDRIVKAGAIFSMDKFTWMNGHYIRQLSTQELTKRLLPFLERPYGKGGLPDQIQRPIDTGYLNKLVPLLQERLKTLASTGEMNTGEMISPFFLDKLDYDVKLLVQKEMDITGARSALEESLRLLEILPDFNAQMLEEKLRALSQVLGLNTRQLFGILRVAITGRTAAPPLFQTMETLDRERCVMRIKAALESLRHVPVL